MLKNIAIIFKYVKTTINIFINANHAKIMVP